MNTYAMSDKAIQQELGRRVRSLRLRRNVTQKALAGSTTLSLNVIKSLESGNGKLSTLIAVMRELDALHELENFIAPPTISPLQLAETQGRVRKRASGKRIKDEAKEDLEW